MDTVGRYAIVSLPTMEGWRKLPAGHWIAHQKPSTSRGQSNPRLLFLSCHISEKTTLMAGHLQMSLVKWIELPQPKVLTEHWEKQLTQSGLGRKVEMCICKALSCLYTSPNIRRARGTEGWKKRGKKEGKKTSCRMMKIMLGGR